MHSTNSKFTTEPIQSRAWVKSDFPLIFYYYLFVLLPLERWGKVSGCILQRVFLAQGTSYTECHGVRFTSPFKQGRKTTGGFLWQRGSNFHWSRSHAVCHSHLGNLVSASGKSQIFAVHFSSQCLNPVANSQPGDDLGQINLQYQLGCTPQYLDSFQILQALLKYLVAHTPGRTCGRPCPSFDFNWRGTFYKGK